MEDQIFNKILFIHKNKNAPMFEKRGFLEQYYLIQTFDHIFLSAFNKI